MARKIASIMFPGEKCSQSVITDVLGMPSGEIDDEKDILQNPNGVSQGYIGKTRLYQTFSRDSFSEPYKYRGMCVKDGIGNMHPETADRVFIISPFHADEPEERQFNKNFARALARSEHLKHGSIPIVPHIYFTEFLKDRGLERDFGIAAGHLAMEHCNRVILAVINGRISEGMRADIDYATLTLGLEPERQDYTRQQAEDFIEGMEGVANAGGEGQHR